MGPRSCFFSPPAPPAAWAPRSRLLVELALVGPPSDKTDANEQPASDVAIEVPPAEEPPPVDLSMLKPIELCPRPSRRPSISPS